MHSDRCCNTRTHKTSCKGSGKEVKIQEFVYRDKTNVAREMYDCTGHNCSQWNDKNSFVVRSGSRAGTHSTDPLQKSAVLRTSHITRKILQSERRGLAWAQQKLYHGEKACDQRQQQQQKQQDKNNNNGN